MEFGVSLDPTTTTLVKFPEGLKQVNTEFKLYTTKHNLKRIYNKINNRNNWKIKLLQKIFKIKKFYEKLKNFMSHPAIVYCGC